MLWRTVVPVAVALAVGVAIGLAIGERPAAPPAPRADDPWAPLDRVETVRARDLLDEPVDGTAGASDAPPPPRPGSAPPVSFAGLGDEPGLRTADWPAIGSFASDLVKARRGGIAGGRDPSMAALEKKALRLLNDAWGRIGRSAESPGLARHPITFLNMMASHLALAGEPLDEKQIDRIEAVGEEYEVERKAIEANPVFVVFPQLRD